MSHQHTSGSKNIATAFFLNFGFCIIELAGGLITNSVAILSDALHDFGDSISLALAWYFEKVAKRSPSARFTYGYKRFSLLGALINSIVLLVGSVIIIYECVLRIIEPQEVQAKGMLILAIFGVIINGIAVLRTRKGSGINERVVSLHLLEDVLGWIAVLVVSIVMLFVDLPILDPILSICIAIFVLYNVFKNLKTTFQVILQGVPSEMNLAAIQTKLQQIPLVQSVHDLHIWSLDSEYNVASLHVVVKNNDNISNNLLTIKQQIKQTMHAEGIEHTTVEFETADEHCEPCETHDIK